MNEIYGYHSPKICISCNANLREEAPYALMSFLLRELGKVWQKPLHQFLDISYVCVARFACIVDNP